MQSLEFPILLLWVINIIIIFYYGTLFSICVYIYIYIRSDFGEGPAIPIFHLKASPTFSPPLLELQATGKHPFNEVSQFGTENSGRSVKHSVPQEQTDPPPFGGGGCLRELANCFTGMFIVKFKERNQERKSATKHSQLRRDVKVCTVQHLGVWHNLRGWPEGSDYRTRRGLWKRGTRLASKALTISNFRFQHFKHLDVWQGIAFPPSFWAKERRGVNKGE